MVHIKDDRKQEHTCSVMEFISTYMKNYQDSNSLIYEIYSSLVEVGFIDEHKEIKAKDLK
jgi:hypothetical protein